jgi:carboxypeptidase Taq
MPNHETPLSNLKTEMREIAVLHSLGAVLGWDERTQMPAKGTELRAEQLSMLAALIHDRFTAPKIGQWLTELAATEMDPDTAVNVREWRRDYDRATKLPSSLVKELSSTSVLAQQAWADARKRSDFAAFEPWLTKLLGLKLQEADCVGYTANRYDALLDEFEPGETAAHLAEVFASLRDPLIELTRKVTESGRPVPSEILERSYPAAAQEALSRKAAAAVGFDFDAGRLDVSVHPFCSGIGPGDTRMTTRYDENYFGDAFFGVLHETGHALYEQGLATKHFGTPLGSAVSLGIHESQSRMWENLVGRSRAFWTRFLPDTRSAFPAALSGVSDGDWYRAINDIRPSFIRTESDETTYNLHILLRFELELAMVNGDLSVADLPGAWNQKMQKFFGITPPDNARGVLQDIHWSGGAFGYFPTYTLGNLYAAQFFEQARIDLGDLDGSFATGDFKPLLRWLRDKIHVHGRRFAPRDLVRRVTGRPPESKPLLDHLAKKAAEVYGV